MRLACTILITCRQGYRKVSTYFVPRILYNLAAGLISMRYGFRGPNHAAVTACATGAHSIGDAMRLIEYGDADVMVAGGSEACINSLAVCAFTKGKYGSTRYAGGRIFSHESVIHQV